MSPNAKLWSSCDFKKSLFGFPSLSQRVPAVPVSRIMSESQYTEIPDLGAYQELGNCSLHDWRKLLSDRIVLYQLMSWGIPAESEHVRELASKYTNKMSVGPLSATEVRDTPPAEASKKEITERSWYTATIGGEAVAPTQLFDVALLLRFFSDHGGDYAMLGIAKAYLYQAFIDRKFSDTELPNPLNTDDFVGERVGDIAVDDLYRLLGENVGPLMLSLDLAHTDEELLRSFKRILKPLRERYGANSRLSHTDAEVSSWVRHKVLEFIDLSLMTWLHGKKLTMSEVGEHLFPEEYDIGLEERVRKVIVPKANKLMTWELIRSLPRQPE